ncbi:MAG: hypothetical protein ACKVZ0_07490 [Gemmatimonadales bacterium]
MAKWLGCAVIVGVLMGCGNRGTSPRAVEPRQCPPSPDLAGPTRLADVFIDRKRIASAVLARVESTSPDSYSLVEPEPPALQAIAPERIDLIQFVSGPDAERDYGLCSGMIGFLITTRRP